MKLSLPLKLAALIVLAAAPSLFATSTGPVPQNFEFQWQGSDGTFSPTFLDITAALGVATSAMTAITDFEITTPNGVWTPGVFTPTTGNPAGNAQFQSTSMLMVSGTTDDPILTFTGLGAILKTAHFEVVLQTGSITGTSTIVGGASMTIADDTTPISLGNWQPVLQDDPNILPDASSSLLLFSVAAIGLTVLQRRLHLLIS